MAGALQIARVAPDRYRHFGLAIRRKMFRRQTHHTHAQMFPPAQGGRQDLAGLWPQIADMRQHLTPDQEASFADDTPDSNGAIIAQMQLGHVPDRQARRADRCLKIADRRLVDDRLDIILHLIALVILPHNEGKDRGRRKRV